MAGNILESPGILYDDFPKYQYPGSSIISLGEAEMLFVGTKKNKLMPIVYRWPLTVPVKLFPVTTLNESERIASKEVFCSNADRITTYAILYSEYRLSEAAIARISSGETEFGNSRSLIQRSPTVGFPTSRTRRFRRTHSLRGMLSPSTSKPLQAPLAKALTNDIAIEITCAHGRV
jgi:hypothetical protein